MKNLIFVLSVLCSSNVFAAKETVHVYAKMGSSSGTSGSGAGTSIQITSGRDSRLIRSDEFDKKLTEDRGKLSSDSRKIADLGSRIAHHDRVIAKTSQEVLARAHKAETLKSDHIVASKETRQAIDTSTQDLVRDVKPLERIDLASMPDPVQLPYEFESAPGEFRDEITRQYTDLYKVEARGFKRETAKVLGLVSTQAADHWYSLGQLGDAQYYKELGKTFLDITIGIDPMTGLGRSTFELFTGRNLVTGVTLSGFERSLAFVGVASLGMTSSAQTAARMYHVFDGAGKLLRERQAFQVAIREGQALYERFLHLTPGLTKHVHIKAIHSAEHVNVTHFPKYVENGTPPFQLGTHVIESATLRDTVWVRLHGLDNRDGPWIIRASSIAGLSAHDIKVKYALPGLPTLASEVHIPKGTTILRGNIQDHGQGAAGALQYWIDKKEISKHEFESWFKNMRSL